MTTADWTAPGLEDWEHLDEIPGVADGVAGQTEYRPPFVEDLVGRTLQLVNDDGRSVEVRFIDAHTLSRTFDDGQTDTATYDATPIRDGIYLVDSIDPSWPVPSAVAVYPRAVTWALDLNTGIITIIVTAIAGHSSEIQPATLLTGHSVRERWNIAGTPGGFHPRTDRHVGNRVLWRYADGEAYEHIYMNGGNFAWQCIRGIEQGLTELNRAQAYEVADDLYMFHWKESKLVIESALLIDLATVRTYGRFFGVEGNGTWVHHQFGARGEILNRTVHPD